MQKYFCQLFILFLLVAGPAQASVCGDLLFKMARTQDWQINLFKQKSKFLNKVKKLWLKNDLELKEFNLKELDLLKDSYSRKSLEELTTVDPKSFTEKLALIETLSKKVYQFDENLILNSRSLIKGKDSLSKMGKVKNLLKKFDFSRAHSVGEVEQFSASLYQIYHHSPLTMLSAPSQFLKTFKQSIPDGALTYMSKAIQQEFLAKGMLEVSGKLLDEPKQKLLPKLFSYVSSPQFLILMETISPIMELSQGAFFPFLFEIPYRPKRAIMRTIIEQPNEMAMATLSEMLPKLKKGATLTYLHNQGAALTLPLFAGYIVYETVQDTMAEVKKVQEEYSPENIQKSLEEEKVEVTYPLDLVGIEAIEAMIMSQLDLNGEIDRETIEPWLEHYEYSLEAFKAEVSPRTWMMVGFLFDE